MTKYAFFEGKIVPIEEAKVSVMTHALHYGTACFGGIRAYWNDEAEQLYVFRLTDHIQRFLSSTKLLLMNLPYSPEHMAKVVLDLLRCEGFKFDSYVGIMAAAVNTFIGFLVLLVIIFVVGQRIYPVKYETRRLVQIGVVSLALFAIGWWLLPGGLWARMAAKSLLVLSFPVILWFTGFFTTAERRRFQQVLSSFAKRRV